jgi:hypothetical protein
MRAYCSSQESAMLTVQSPDDKGNQTTEIDRFTEIRIPLSPSAGNNFRTLTISPAASKPFGDVRFHLYDEKFPYVWVTLD